MSDKPKTVEVTLAKKHTHKGVDYAKGDVIEIRVADVPFLEDIKALEADSIRPVGTKKAGEDAEAAARKKELDARVASFDKQVSASKVEVAETPAAKVDVASASTKENK